MLHPSIPSFPSKNKKTKTKTKPISKKQTTIAPPQQSSKNPFPTVSFPRAVDSFQLLFFSTLFRESDAAEDIDLHTRQRRLIFLLRGGGREGSEERFFVHF